MSSESSGGALRGEKSSTPQRPIRRALQATPLDDLSGLGAALPTDAPDRHEDRTGASSKPPPAKLGRIADPHDRSGIPNIEVLQLINYEDESSIRDAFPKLPDTEKKRYGKCHVPPHILAIPDLIERAWAIKRWRELSPKQQADVIESIAAAAEEAKKKAAREQARGRRTQRRSAEITKQEEKAKADTEKKEAAEAAARNREAAAAARRETKENEAAARAEKKKKADATYEGGRALFS